MLPKLPKCDTEAQSEQSYWKNGSDRFAQYRVATKFQFANYEISEKCNKVKCSKTKV